MLKTSACVCVRFVGGCYGYDSLEVFETDGQHSAYKLTWVNLFAQRTQLSKDLHILMAWLVYLLYIVVTICLLIG